jgi:2-dehydropantoate 2-reductase
MRIAVLGAGAVGSTYGALLARGGNDVVLLDVWREHVDAIERDGLVLEAPDGAATTVRVPASTDMSRVAGAAAVLVLTKSFATAAAARSIAPSLDPGAIVATLQNGLGNDRVLAAELGTGRVVQGATTIGAELRGPGRVRTSGGALSAGSVTSLGAPPDGTPARARVDELARALDGSGLPAHVTADIAAVAWGKLAMAGPMGPLCGVLGCTIADVLASPAALAVLRRLFDELMAVAVADGARLEPARFWDAAIATFEMVGPHSPSTAVDIAAGRPTEIEALAGEVVRRGAAHGVPTPYTGLVAAVVRSIPSSARDGRAELAAAPPSPARDALLSVAVAR